MSPPPSDPGADPGRPEEVRPGPGGGGARDRPRGAIGLLAAGALAYLASVAAGRAPTLVESLYVDRALSLVVSPLSRLTGAVPLAVAELLLAAYVARRLWTGLRGLAAAREPGRSRRRAALRGAWLLLRDLGAGVLLFYLLWGFSYARAPLTERIGLPELAADEAPELLARLARRSVDEANRHYRRLHGSEDAGSPTAMPASWRELSDPLRRGWETTTGELRLGPEVRLRYGPPKRAFLSPLLARLGLAGFYFPYTAEAVVNGRTPAVSLATTLAHEQAHQRGITDEGEATFLAHLVAGRSGSSLLAYSAAVRAQGRLLGALRGLDPERAEEIAERRLAGVRRDLEDLAEYHRRYRGPARRVARSVNDAYLRANRVPGGAASYDRVTELILRHAALRGELYPSSGDPIRRPSPAPPPN